MSNIAIRTENLSKQYRLGIKQARYKTLRESLAGSISNPLRQIGDLLRGGNNGARRARPTMWALRDVSIEIKHGEAVGIIGRNGAGKSTLLKIICSITEPTRGYAEVTGRVGSLLEVGTGFHPELTGRENVYLNGVILGMSKKAIDRKFDEIVAFAEFEHFIDTPVKRYSSGMQARLAFAVAAHLESEILVVDEVLAVGDARFQRRCLNKMEDMGQSGRTVLFVSHNMASISRLCQRAILLDEGRVVSDGPAHEVVSFYMNSELGTKAAREWSDPARAPGGKIARLRAVRVLRRNGMVTGSIDIRESIGIEIEYDVTKSGHLLLPHFYLWNEEGIPILGALDVDPAWRRRPRPAGRYISRGWIPGNLLAEGTVFVDIAVLAIEPTIQQIYERSIVSFQIIDSLEGDTARGDWAGPIGGVIRPMLEWTTQYSPVGAQTVVTSDRRAD